MHTALIGASRGIGLATALDLLADPSNSASLLLRNPSSIEHDERFRLPISQGRVRIVKGDANDTGNLMKLLDWEGIDSVVFTLGAVYPDGKRRFTWSKGFLLPSLDVCTNATLRLVRVLDELYKRDGKPAPAVVAISVTGVGKSAGFLPYVYKAILPWLLQQTIADKRGLETVLSHASASLPADFDPPSPEVLPPASLGAISKGFLSDVLIVRPAQLKDTNGTRSLRAGEDVSTYSTGRVELGRWIAKALRNRQEWMNRRVTVGF